MTKLGTKIPFENTEKGRKFFQENIRKLIPNRFPQKNYVVSLANMDLRFRDSPIFHDRVATKELLGKGLSFDEPRLHMAWNTALSDDEIKLHSNSSSGRVILSCDEEKVTFLQFNYARYRVHKLFRRLKSEVNGETLSKLVEWGKRMRGSRDTLVVANIGLIFSMGNRYGYFKNCDKTELVSEGFNSLMRSVDGFNVEKGFKFSTYACRSIVKAMARQREKNAHRLSKEFPSSLDIVPESKIVEVDYLADEIDNLKFVLSKNKAELTKNEKIVIAKRYTSKMKLDEIGAVLGLSKERIRQIQEEALEKLRIQIVMV